MTVALTYDTTLSRVRIAATDLDIGATTARFERSTNGIVWSTVRGGTAVAVSGQAASLDDYEFAADVVNTYRVIGIDDIGQEAGPLSASITPTLTSVWIKQLSRPFLNRTVTVVDWGDVEQPARNGVFPIIGRSFPVAVTDVRLSQSYELTVMAPTVAAAEDLRLCLASGDPIFLHVPADAPFPGMYAVVGDLAISRQSRRADRRYFPLPLTEVAAPGPDIVGATVTWANIIANFATWGDLITAEATWHDVAERIGDPTDIVVP